MRRAILSVAAFALLTSTASAATKADSLLAFTGTTRAKFVWMRIPWCDANYNPIQAYKPDVNCMSKNTQLMVFDTDDGKVRYIDSTTGSHTMVRITRKNGNYVIWTDVINNCSWIRDLACTQPKRKLLEKVNGDWFVSHCGYSSAKDSEYVYVLGKFDGQWSARDVIRMPLKADYTVDVTKKYKIPMRFDTATVCNQFDCGDDPNAYLNADWHISASEDGQYLCGEFPQPNIGLVNTTTAAFLPRHDTRDEYGCQQNIAPDNSYRVFHLNDSHQILRMWGPSLSTDHWDVSVVQNLPGNSGSTAINADILEVRWSNHPQFFTHCYPGDGSGIRDGIYNLNSTQVKALAPNQAGCFVVGKFSQDFKSVESFALVSGLDARNRDLNGDAWFSPIPPVTPVDAGRTGMAMRTTGFATITAVGARVNATFGSAGMHTLALINTRGQVVARASGTGSLTCSAIGTPAGAYMARATSGEGVVTTPVLLTE